MIKLGHDVKLIRPAYVQTYVKRGKSDAVDAAAICEALICRKTGNLRAVQLLLGHTKVNGSVRYLGVELENALSIAEKIDI